MEAPRPCCTARRHDRCSTACVARGPDEAAATLVGRVIERSLPLWRDAPELSVVCDQLIGRPADPDDSAAGKRSLRPVLQRANDNFVGAVGLSEYLSPRRPERPAGGDRPLVGDFIMVVNATDLGSRWPRVAAVPGVWLVARRVPGARRGTIPVMVSMVRDPDGHSVELDQIPGTPAGSGE